MVAHASQRERDRLLADLTRLLYSDGNRYLPAAVSGCSSVSNDTSCRHSVIEEVSGQSPQRSVSEWPGLRNAKSEYGRSDAAAYTFEEELLRFATEDSAGRVD